MFWKQLQLITIWTNKSPELFMGGTAIFFLEIITDINWSYIVLYVNTYEGIYNTLDCLTVIVWKIGPWISCFYNTVIAIKYFKVKMSLVFREERSLL